MNPLILTVLLLFSNPAWAGGGSYLSQTFNFILLIVLLFVLTHKPIRLALRNRATDIEDSIQKNQAILEQAQKRFDEISAQLTNFDKRVQEMEAQTESDIAAMKVELRKRAEDDADRVRSSAQLAIREEARRARSALQTEAAEIAVALATQTIKNQINEEDHKRLSNDFVSAVSKGGLHG
jgi:F-type H+-transporting ATPase subunit b